MHELLRPFAFEFFLVDEGVAIARVLHDNLSIMYRPGVLHVIPDALSRMYMSSYSDNVDSWGTHSNIQIMDAFNKSASPSDFLCQQSIDAISPPTPARKRHLIPT